MSLDVWLKLPGVQKIAGSHILIREDGGTKEISREEWDRRFPDREPVTVECPSDDTTVWEYNITHNLGHMAEEAGIYKELWRPEELGITKAKQLIAPLKQGLLLLMTEPDRFRAFNPSNGWGDYDGLIQFVGKYYIACCNYPDADVEVSR
jgi:hypothetical protein